jgi:hypothetical protein
VRSSLALHQLRRLLRFPVILRVSLLRRFLRLQCAGFCAACWGWLQGTLESGFRRIDIVPARKTVVALFPAPPLVAKTAMVCMEDSRDSRRMLGSGGYCRPCAAETQRKNRPASTGPSTAKNLKAATGKRYIDRWSVRVEDSAGFKEEPVEPSALRTMQTAVAAAVNRIARTNRVAPAFPAAPHGTATGNARASPPASVGADPGSGAWWPPALQQQRQVGRFPGQKRQAGRQDSGVIFGPAEVAQPRLRAVTWPWQVRPWSPQAQ